MQLEQGTGVRRTKIVAAMHAVVVAVAMVARLDGKTWLTPTTRPAYHETFDLLTVCFKEDQAGADIDIDVNVDVIPIQEMCASSEVRTRPSTLKIRCRTAAIARDVCKEVWCCRPCRHWHGLYNQ